MPDPSERSIPRGFVPPSSDQASSQPPHAYGRYNAPEGNAYAQGGYATPEQAFSQESALSYQKRSPLQQGPLDTYPRLQSFDSYSQVAWDWTQQLDWTQLPTPYEPQGELIQELREHKGPADNFSSPLFTNPLAPPARPLSHRLSKSPKMKRKSDAEPQTVLQQGTNEQQNPTKRRAMSRASSTASQSPAPTALADAQQSPVANAAQIAASANQSSIQGSGEALRRRNASKGTGPQGREFDISEPRRVVESSGSSDMLPAGRVFPIQIGSALFRLSGASLCSDAPSYFSHFFSEQLHNNSGRASEVRTLYIDRDPDTFRDIALHLQGYHIVPRDGEHFVKLFADAQFYSLPRLTKQLFKSDIFIFIGGTPFRIPRDSFSAPGDSPNYFSLGFAQWFSTPSEVFPGLDRSALLRPPSISPPSVPNKSGEIFGELMRMLQGYDVEIRNETHRANLLRDARYFHLKGLEQRIVACEKTYNLKREQNEILMRLEDIRQSGISHTPWPSTTSSYVTYARPYTDDAISVHVLVFETSSTEIATLRPQPSPSASSDSVLAHVMFQHDTLRRMTSLLKIIASKIGLPSTQSLAPTQISPTDSLTPIRPDTNLALKARIDRDCALTVDGKPFYLGATDNTTSIEPHSFTALPECVIRRAHWRIRIERRSEDDESTTQAVLEGVKIEAFTREQARNASRGFLA